MDMGRRHHYPGVDRLLLLFRHLYSADLFAPFVFRAGFDGSRVTSPVSSESDPVSEDRYLYLFRSWLRHPPRLFGRHTPGFRWPAESFRPAAWIFAVTDWYRALVFYVSHRHPPKEEPYSQG